MSKKKPFSPIQASSYSGRLAPKGRTGRIFRSLTEQRKQARAKADLRNGRSSATSTPSGLEKSTDPTE